jgi:hypothetical protein
LADDMAEMSVLLPAFGKPTIPTSASSLSSRTSSNSCPGSPGCVLRGLVGRGREGGVAEPPAAALGDDDALAGLDEVGDDLARGLVADQRPLRDREHDVLLRSAGLVLAAAVLAVAGAVDRAVAEVDEGLDVRVSSTTMSAPAAVACRRVPIGMCFSARAQAAAAAVALDGDRHLVDEHAPPSKKTTRRAR